MARRTYRQVFVPGAEVDVDQEDAALEDGAAAAKEEPAAARDIRAASRSAAVALGASVLVFGVMVALVVYTNDLPKAAAPLQPSSVVGLNEAQRTMASLESAQGALPALGGAQPSLGFAAAAAAAAAVPSSPTDLLPSSHHTLASAILYKKPSAGSPVVRTVAAGEQVFPVKSQGNWVEVVAFSEKDHSVPAFGWFFLKDGMGAILKRDPRTVRQRPAGPPPTKEEIHQRWQEVRTNNEKLKAQLAETEERLKNQYIQSLRSSQEKVGQQYAQRAKRVVNLKGLHNDVTKLRDEVKKELKEPPSKLLDELANLVK